VLLGFAEREKEIPAHYTLLAVLIVAGELAVSTAHN